MQILMVLRAFLSTQLKFNLSAEILSFLIRNTSVTLEDKGFSCHMMNIRY